MNLKKNQIKDMVLLNKFGRDPKNLVELFKINLYGIKYENN